MKYYRHTRNKWMICTAIEQHYLPKYWVSITEEECTMYMVMGYRMVYVRVTKELDTKAGVYKESASVTDAKTGEQIL